MTALLGLLVVDQERQTATTRYVYVPPGTPAPDGLPVSEQPVELADSRLVAEVPHAAVGVEPETR